MPETTIAVAADLHYIAPALTDHGAYFQELIRHSDGKVMDYIEELTDAFLAQIIQEAPDALILCGDVSFNGARQSHEALAEKLRAVEEAGIPVLVLPGNHDLNNTNAACFSGGGFERTDSVTAEEFAEIYGDFGFQDALARDSASLSYVFALSPSLRVLMLDVNTAEAPNTVKAETLAWAEAQLQDAAQAGAQVVAVSHQNVLQHNSMFVSGYLITNSRELLALYEEYGVTVSLTGHLHCQHISQSGDGFYEIATSALSVSPNQYGVLTLDGASLQYHTVVTDVSAWAEENGSSDPALLAFADYARQFFLDSALDQGLAEAGDTEEGQAMAEFLAGLNAAYFAGRMDTVDPDSPYFALWQATGSFTARYIDSILADGFAGFTSLTVPYPSSPST